MTAQPTTAAVVATPAEDPDPAVEIDSAVCKETGGGGLSCTGTIRNASEMRIGPVVLTASLFDGPRFVDTVRVALAPRLLASEQSAPFHIYVPLETDGPVVLSAEEIQSPSQDAVSLTVSASGVLTGDGIYQLNATLSNPFRAPVRAVRAVAALYDGTSLVAYRIVEFDRLREGAAVSFVLQWHEAPAAGRGLRHSLSADGLLDVR